MKVLRLKLSLSKRFQVLVVAAFVFSLALGAIALFSLDKFYTTFQDYKIFADKEKAVISLSNHLLVRERLIGKYFQSYDGKYIRSIEENHQKIIQGFDLLSNIALTTAQQELTEKNLALYQKNVLNLEKLFTLNGELFSLQKQKLNLEQYFITSLQSVYMKTKDKSAQGRVEHLMNAILGISYSTNLHLVSHEPTENVEKELAEVSQSLQKFLLEYPYLLQQDSVFKKNLAYYMVLLEDFNKILVQYRAQYRVFNESNLLQVDSSLVELEQAFYKNQKEIYAKWGTKHSFAWHFAIVVGLFALVALSWLMVALSQLFSLKK